MWLGKISGESLNFTVTGRENALHYWTGVLQSVCSLFRVVDECNIPATAFNYRSVSLLWPSYRANHASQNARYIWNTRGNTVELNSKLNQDQVLT